MVGRTGGPQPITVPSEDPLTLPRSSLRLRRSARAGGRTWGSSMAIGTADALLGLAVVEANALIK
ncbi:hypothetical protein CJI59_02780 [Streptomyces sp. Alain-F2R5]|nr:hypothetical protein CJI59_02780 [Streptomyces sp. Alain-F2R5]